MEHPDALTALSALQVLRSLPIRLWAARGFLDSDQVLASFDPQPERVRASE
jgi:hypothetical protein